MQLMVTLLLVVFSSLHGCGQRSNSTETLSPTDPFDKYYTPINDTTDCESTKTCNGIKLSGSALSGTFLFSQLSASCKSGPEGYSIKLTNATTNPTFQMGISLYKIVTPAVTAYACKGVEYTSTQPIILIKEGYCDVQILIHGKPFFATDLDPCTVTFTKSDPVQGLVYCPQFVTDSRTVTIEAGSSFSCPAE